MSQPLTVFRSVQRVSGFLTMAPPVLLLVLWVPIATGQNTLGELLDAGAKRVSAEEFWSDLVQRAIVGPTPPGGTIELIYVPNGTIQGAGSYQRAGTTTAPIFGEWSLDAEGRICSSMRVGAINPGGEVNLPSRCQVWFKYDSQYFVSDSDWDRSAKVLRRTVNR